MYPSEKFKSDSVQLDRPTSSCAASVCTRRFASRVLDSDVRSSPVRSRSDDVLARLLHASQAPALEHAGVRTDGLYS